MSIQISTKEEMMAWITTIYQQGIRRPGYDADYWVEIWIEEKLKSFGFNQITLQPLKIKKWKAENPKLQIWKKSIPDDVLEIPCFPIPYTASAKDVNGQVTKNQYEDLNGKIILNRLNLIKLPTSSLKNLSHF